MEYFASVPFFELTYLALELASEYLLSNANSQKFSLRCDVDSEVKWWALHTSTHRPQGYQPFGQRRSLPRDARIE
jgi:hypothetical protein